MKPAKKFVIGAVYAWEGGIPSYWSASVCVCSGNYDTARLVVCGTEDYPQAPNQYLRPLYRIRARDWEPISGTLGLLLNMWPAQREVYSAVPPGKEERLSGKRMEEKTPAQIEAEIRAFFAKEAERGLKPDQSPQDTFDKAEVWAMYQIDPLSLHMPAYAMVLPKSEGPTCTCGKGAVEARLHWDSCVRKEGK